MLIAKTTKELQVTDRNLLFLNFCPLRRSKIKRRGVPPSSRGIDAFELPVGGGAQHGMNTARVEFGLRRGDGFGCRRKHATSIALGTGRPCAARARPKNTAASAARTVTLL